MRIQKIKILFTGALLCMASTFSNAQQAQGLYINFIYSWLGDSTQEAEILQYCANSNFNSITLYDLNRLNWNHSDQVRLASFINRAKTQYGIAHVGAAGETYNFFRNSVIPYNLSRSNASEQFDVMNFEFEFWIPSSIVSYYGPNYLTPNGLPSDTSGAFTFAIQQFQKIDSIGNVYGLTSEIYLGWPNTGQMQQIAAVADRILLHSYRTDDLDVYQYTRSRLYDIASINRPVQTRPIFSAEPDFMGPWLNWHPITQPYQTYSTDYAADSAGLGPNIRMTGYQWFLYSLMPKSTLVNASISTNGPLSFCSGGSVTLTASTGVAYLWSPGGQTTSSIVVNTPGIYSVTVTDGSGNTATSPTVTVSVTTAGPTPVVTANGPTVLCSGNNVTLSTGYADSYLWSNGATGQSITVNNAGNYFVTTTTNGCTQLSAITHVTIVVPPAEPVITTGGSTNICPGTPLTLTSSPGAGYLWSNGQTTRSIVVNGGSSYSVRVYSGPYCFTTSAAIAVSLLQAPATPVITASGSTNLTPSQPNVVLSSTAANAYFWSTTETTQNILVNSQGSYRVTVTAANGCSATSAPVLVSANGCTPPPVPVISVNGSNIISPGQSVTLSCSPAGGYLWSTWETTQSIVVSAPGTYTVRAYNAGYCFSTSDPVTIIMVSVRMAAPGSATMTEALQLSAYPNPAKNEMHVAFTAGNDGRDRLDLVDISGRNVLDREIEVQAGKNEVILDVSMLRPGMYFVGLSSHETDRLRVIIQ